MSQLSRERNGNFPNNGENKERMKASKSNGGGNTNSPSFKSNKILSNLPGHEPLDAAGTPAKGFQDLRNSSIRRGKI